MQTNHANQKLKQIHNGTEMSFHHRVTQSITEFYSFDFKLIKLCETQCYSVVRRFITRPKRAYPAEYIRKRQELNAFFSRKVGLEQANYSKEKTF